MPVSAGPASGGWLANGSISPARFVKPDTSGKPAGGYVIQCVGSDRPVGISVNSVHNPPLAGLDDGFAAVAGGSLKVYQDNEVCLLQVGVTAVNAGDYIKPDSTGRGTPAGSDGDIYGAMALESAPGDGISLFRVVVIRGSYRGA